MIWLYVASAIFGGAFVIPMMLGGLDFDSDVGELDIGDADFDLDVDADLDLDAGDVDGGDGIGGALGDFVGSLLSFRSIAMAALFFGIAGIVFTVLDTAAAVAFVTAVALGFLAAATNSALTNFIVRGQQSSHVTLRDMQGMSAQVLLPISDAQRGRVRAEVAGQTEYFTAVPFKAGQSFETGDNVVVIEVERGMAKVASLRELGH